jgi:hypothetical protein
MFALPFVIVSYGYTKRNLLCSFPHHTKAQWYFMRWQLFCSCRCLSFVVAFGFGLFISFHYAFVFFKLCNLLWTMLRPFRFCNDGAINIIIMVFVFGHSCCVDFYCSFYFFLFVLVCFLLASVVVALFSEFSFYLYLLGAHVLLANSAKWEMGICLL